MVSLLQIYMFNVIVVGWRCCCWSHRRSNHWICSRPQGLSNTVFSTHEQFLTKNLQEYIIFWGRILLPPHLKAVFPMLLRVCYYCIMVTTTMYLPKALFGSDGSASCLIDTKVARWMFCSMFYAYIWTHTGSSARLYWIESRSCLCLILHLFVPIQRSHGFYERERLSILSRLNWFCCPFERLATFAGYLFPNGAIW